MLLRHTGVHTWRDVRHDALSVQVFIPGVTSDMAGLGGGKKTRCYVVQVFIPGVTSDMMGLIIDYAYTRETDVTAENVERLLPAADQFHVLGLVKRCCDYLATGLDVDNCIGIRNFGRTYFCNNLERIANRYAATFAPLM